MTPTLNLGEHLSMITGPPGAPSSGWSPRR